MHSQALKLILLAAVVLQAIIGLGTLSAPEGAWHAVPGVFSPQAWSGR
jgi:hypothetical protein